MIYVTLALLCIVCSCEGERWCCVVSVYLATFTKNEVYTMLGCLLHDVGLDMLIAVCSLY